ncbi:MAG: 2-C-methyl-D-erythritol 2,4-cyclodiphosphate synthase [Bacteroidia bacterium]|nr:2-C-methyl-D-erythritol 2,4-cyclodiphosphate synthase [Bacteroidia bacterium]
MNFRIGFGYDVHRLADGEELIIGGLKIEHNKGTVAHSDGDVLIHAICDALLGAANLRDIGFHFPDNQMEWEKADSKIFLKKTIELLRSNGYLVGNIDTTLCLQKPKIHEFVPEIISILAGCMGISEGNISVKATTTEELGFVGKEEGISAYAIALIFNDKN